MRPDEAAGPSPGVSFLPRAPLPPTPRATPISAAATAAKLARRKTDTVDLHSDQNSGPGPPQEVDGTAAWLANQTPQHRGRTYRANGELPTPLESANDILHERSTELDGSPLTRKYLTSLRRLADVERNLDASEDHVGQVTRELQALKVRNNLSQHWLRRQLTMLSGPSRNFLKSARKRRSS